MLKNSLKFENMNIIKKIPIPISGLILALLSLGNILTEVHPYLKYTFGSIGVIFLILLLLKIIFYRDCIKNDFKNPIIVSSSGTFSMSLMILSTYIIPFTSSFAYVLWIIGIVLHILLMIYFTYHFIIRNFNISTVYPSYWIVFVGITMVAITSHNHNVETIGYIFFIIGFINMLLTTPLIIYRYIQYPDVPDMNKPLICIFTALMSILIVGYTNSAPHISNEFIICLYSIGLVFYIFSIYKFINYRNLDFYPSFSAFTFPFVISANATKNIVTYSNSNFILNNLLTLEISIAIIIVIYILIRYIEFLKNS